MIMGMALIAQVKLAARNEFRKEEPLPVVAIYGNNHLLQHIP